MTEGLQSLPRLETHRFAPSHESLAKMKILRDNLTEVQGQIPEVRGLTYFGSRTVGREHSDPDNPSDMDVIVFYDGSNLIPQQNAMIMEKGRLMVNKLARPEREQMAQQRTNLVNRIENSYSDQLHALSLPVEFNQETGHNATIQIFDISPKATDIALREFEREVDISTNYGKEPLKIERVTPTTFELLSRFYLGVGDGLYQSRQYILDQFTAMPNGERYFSALMSHLNYHERTKSTEKRAGLSPARLPSSISEGREYFITRQQAAA